MTTQQHITNVTSKISMTTYTLHKRDKLLQHVAQQPLC